MKLPSLYLFFLLLTTTLLLTLACEKEKVEETVDLFQQSQEHVIKADGYGCGELRKIDFLQGGESINELLVVDGVIYYTNFDEELKAYSIPLNQTRLIAEEIVVRSMELQFEDIYFCTFSGIYSLRINDFTSFTQRSTHTCWAMDVYGEGEIAFVGYGSGVGQSAVNFHTINQINEEGEGIPLTEVVEDELSKLGVLDNGAIMAFNIGNSDKLYRFDHQGNVTNVFTKDNSPLGEGHFDASIWIETIGNRFFAVSKNGLGFPKIIEWNDDLMEWNNYLPEELEDEAYQSQRWKASDISAPKYSDIDLDGNILYISTILSGCRGMQRMHLTPGLPLTLDDIDIIRDSTLQIGHCLQGVQVDEVNNTKYIFSQRQLVLLEDCN